MKTQKVEKKLNKVADATSKSLQIFTDTIAELNTANKELDAVVVEAKDGMAYYSDVLAKAEAQRQENEVVIAKMTELINN